MNILSTPREKPEADQQAELANAITLLETIKQRVVQEIKANDGADLTRSSSQRVLDELKSSELLGRLVDQQIQRRLRTIALIGVPLLTAIGWVSISQVLDSLKKQAAEQASSVVKEHLQTLPAALEKQTKNASEAFDARTKSALEAVDRRLKEVRDDSKEMEERLRKQREQVEDNSRAKINEVTSVIEARRASFRDEIEKLAAQQQQLALSTIETKKNEATTEVIAQTRKISEAAAIEINRIKREAQEGVGVPQGASVNSPLRTKSRSPDDPDPDYSPAVEIKARRLFDGIVPKAKTALADGKIEQIRGILDPLLVRPELYTPGDRLEALGLLLSPRLSETARYMNIIETIMPAARVDDKAMLPGIVAEMGKNYQYAVNQDDLAEFGVAILKGEDKTTIETKFLELKLEDLTARGLSNVIILAKKNGLSPSRTLEAETLLIKKISSDPRVIDSPLDYVLSSLIIEAFSRPPLGDTKGISAVIARIEEMVFPARFANNDPWRLKEKIAAIKAQLPK